ncbi:MAG: NDP-hexose 3,4-dehydratase [Parcubacteria group bacterium Athens0714_26]|nr:MAG: NDP-hexose 3,4-dehydratase [Parcubacteria group bacterium Athens0714_26]
MKKHVKMRVSYAAAVYDKAEINAVNKVLANPNHLVQGPLVKQFEQKIAFLFGKNHGVMVNSGSSANLIAIESLNLPRGSEVITPVLTFATTLAPLIQKGLVPVFVDVKPGTYVIDADKIESLITSKTRLLMIPSLIGNIPDMIRLREIAKKYNLLFIEDSCDTLGAKFGGKPTGYYSDISTTSFYASHIITAAASGGMICFNNPELANRALIMSNWGRNSTLFGFYEKSEELKKRFAGVLDGDTYDAKFIFSEIGYNFQPTEINGAFGLEQLKKFPKFLKRRKDNFKELLKFFGRYENFFILPKQDSRADTAWLSFPLTIKPGVKFSRLDITKYLEENNIQTRPIFTGNVLKQPAFRGIKGVKLAKGGYPVADYVMKNSFLIGCHQGMGRKHLDYMKEVFGEFLDKYKS